MNSNNFKNQFSILGVVIVNYNNWIETIQCIKSIWDQELKHQVKVFIVDNASPLQPDYEYKDFFNTENIEVIYNEKNSGYAAGNNIGIRRAIKEGCTEILITNSDIIFHNGCIQGLVEGLESNSHVGITAPQIRNIDGTIDNRNFINL